MQEITHMELPWPDWAQYRPGDLVRLKDNANGKKPPYRFPGRVCGIYMNPVSRSLGYCISSLYEEGCIQIYPEARLEKVGGNGAKGWQDVTSSRPMSGIGGEYQKIQGGADAEPRDKGEGEGSA